MMSSSLFVKLCTFGAIFCFAFWLLRLTHAAGGASVGARLRWSVAFVLAVILASFWVGSGRSDFLTLFSLIGVGGLLLVCIPKWMQVRRKKERADAFRRGLVELTVSLANGLRGGGAMGQTLTRVVRDMRGVVAEELNQLLDEHRVGVDFATGFDNLRKRMPSEDMALLAMAVKLTLSTGGSLAEVLEKMTGMMRERNEFDERLKTMTAQGRFEAIAMGLAPVAAFLVLFLIDRSMVEPLYTTTTGQMAIGVVLVLEAFGFYFINKIVTIEV